MSLSHTFAVCAYEKSRYLESCIKSLINQTVKTNIIICTSTPSTYIEDIAHKYDIPLFVRAGVSDIQDDWNYACSCADTDLVTVAHQDDYYRKDYAEKILSHAMKYPDSTIIFSDYRPLKHYMITYDINCFVRRLLRFPIWSNYFGNFNVCKMFCLLFGNTICCSAVTYNMQNLTKPIFTSKFKFSLDWDTFYNLARKSGRFVYIDKPLTYFRVHSGATTNKFIISKGRYKEDTEMFEKIWGKHLANLIMKLYVLAYRTYKD